MRLRIRRMLAIAAGVAVLATGLAVSAPAERTEAVTAADWNAGNIISDALFYDSTAMTEAEIQTFLNGMVGACGNSLCVKNLRVNVDSRAASYSNSTGNLICRAFQGGYLSAAAIIFRAQQACSISAKVILVTLQKEQGLVTSPSPSQGAVDRAMGMACPDTAPCAAYALGFGNQVYLGAKQLMTYKADRFARQPGIQSIGFHPNTACGSTVVNVQNYATAALYSYTPYQPNAAALANMNGVGDSCSSYGNRNFWRFYNSWFGSTQGFPVGSLNTAPGLVTIDGTGGLKLYRGDGRGSWSVVSDLASGRTDLVTAFGAGDFDGDGQRDILAVNTAKELLLFPIDNEGQLGTSRVVATGWNADLTFSPGDFNRDGVPDVMSRDASGNLTLWAGTGRGKLQPPRIVGWGWGAMTYIFSPGDFTGDGRPDVMARDASGNLYVYAGDGSVSWLWGRQIGVGWGGMTFITSAGDFTGDGNGDLLARTAGGLLYLYRGNGAAGFIGDGTQIGIGWQGMTSIAGIGAPAVRQFVEPGGVGDLDGDGARDVLAVTASGDALLYRGNAASGWRSSLVAATGWGGMTAIMGAGDFDRNGTPDVITRDAGGFLWLYSGDGTGKLGSPKQIGHGWSSFTAIMVAGDQNGDGTIDLLARDPGGVLWLYPSNGAGAFGVAKQVGNGWNIMDTLVPAGDFDSDGYPDLLARDTSGLLWLYAGTGASGWLPGRQIGVGWGGMSNIYSPGDFTGDRVPDVMARHVDGSLWLYGGDGRGGWASARQIGVGWGGMKWIG